MYMHISVRDLGYASVKPLITYDPSDVRLVPFQ